MKKIYSQPEWKIVNFMTEDVITASVTVTYDNEGLFSEDQKVEIWGW